MPLNKLDARLLNIDRIIQNGKKDTLELVDSNTKEVIASVRLWNWKKLNPAEPTAPTYKFYMAQEPSTKEYLPSCLIAFNGIIHDVPSRSEPESTTGVIWEFRTRPTNEAVE